MNGVLGALDLLRHSALDAEQRTLVRTAASSGASLMAILNDVLDHSKIEAGKLALSPAPLSLRALSSSVVALFRGNAESKGLRLGLHVDTDLEDWVVTDCPATQAGAAEPRRERHQVHREARSRCA